MSTKSAAIPHHDWDALPQDTQIQQDGSGRSSGQGQSKSELLAQLMGKPETYDQFESAWRLAMWLMIVENGVVVCSYEHVASRLGNNSRATVRKWADLLVQKGVITRKQKGNDVELRLLGDYMQVAEAPADINVPCQILPPVHPNMLALKKIFDGTDELGGQIAIRIDGLKLSGRR